MAPLKRAVVYARQSKTRDRSESLQAQVRACTDAAERLGATVVATLIEPPSTSAYKDRGRGRAKFTELLETLRRGEAEAVIVYKTDRLSRGGGPGWAPLIEAFEAAGNDSDRAVGTPEGWLSEFECGIRATMDREESKKSAERLRDLQERLAADGRYGGGGRRPFGYGRDGVAVVAEEAELVREAAGRVLAGESCHAIAADWLERGVRGVGGGHFRPHHIRQLLLSPRLAGLRVHRGQVTGEAAWEPILARNVWDDLRDRLVNPSPTLRSTARQHLLVGFLRCGKCGALLTSSMGSYVCKARTEGGCRGVKVVASPLEAEVLGRLVAAVNRPALRQRRHRRAPDVSERVEKLEHRLEQLAQDHYVDQSITRAEFFAARQGLQAQLDRLRAQAARQRREQAATAWLGRGAELLDLWSRFTLEEKRAVLALYVESITMLPAARRGPRFDPDRVRVSWR